MNDQGLRELIIEATKDNESFSKKMPGLQLGIDSTSLGEYKVCPRKYLFGQILGFTPQDTSVHLVFGIHVHKALERYAHARAHAGHEEALEEVVQKLLEDTWDKTRNRPWLSSDPNKNRMTLLRTVVWYLDRFQEDSMETVILANGRPAVELSFRFDSGYKSSVTKEEFIFCGHIDRIAKFNGMTVILDPKTTKSGLGAYFFNSFTPGNQFSMYALAGQVAFQQKISMIIVDGIQVLVGESRFQRGLAPRSPEIIAEWHHEQGFWLAQMETSAQFLSWPGNDKSCGQYGGCQFREVCEKGPNQRLQWLRDNYAKRQWDPLKVRGEI